MVEKHENEKILVVDDEPLNLRLVGELLRRGGLDFIFASSGFEALEVVESHKPSLILMDLMMPGMDGLEACRRLKSDKKTEHIPVIFLTAVDKIEDIVSGFASGGVDFIKKPFIREELLARVHTHLTLGRSRKKLEELYDKQSALLATIAHGIKNPVGSICNLALLLDEDIEENSYDIEEISSSLKLIASSAGGMLELVNETLDIELDSVAKGQKTELVDLEGIVRHLIEINEVMARKKNIQISYQYALTRDIFISKRVAFEMFDNLLSNAVKYSENNSRITVRLVSSEVYEDGIRFEVEDAAPLIDEDTRSMLFEPYTRGDKLPSQLSGATSHGIGLSIVKRLVDIYNGHVDVKLREDKTGNIFFIDIPSLAS